MRIVPSFILLAMLLDPALAQAASPADPVTRAYKIEIEGQKNLAKAKPPWFAPYRGQLLTKRLAALFARDEKYGVESGGVGLLDWDPFLNGQDGEFKDLTIKIVSQTEARGVVEARFTSFKSPVSILFDMVQESGSWRIDDIHPRDEKGARSSIAELLSGKHECGSEVGKTCD